LYKRAGTTLRCDFGRDDVIHTIFVTSGTVNLDEFPVKAAVDSKIPAIDGQAPMHGMQPPPEVRRAEAHLFGTVFGGLAHQYDLCSAAGFLPGGQQTAEETAGAILAKMAKVGDQAESMPDIQKGWSEARSAVDRDRANQITEERCAAVGKRWNKWMATLADTTR
jgi:hypothetical protein